MNPSSFDELDSDAARRALDFYLNPAPTKPWGLTDAPLVIARTDLTADQAAGYASTLLRSAATTAFQAADGLNGAPQEMTYSVMHMINMARALLERSITEQAKFNDLMMAEAHYAAENKE